MKLEAAPECYDQAHSLHLKTPAHRRSYDAMSNGKSSIAGQVLFITSMSDFSSPNDTTHTVKSQATICRRNPDMGLLIIFAFILVLLCLRTLRTRFSRGLSKVPGPFIASISNLWKVNAVYKGDMPRRNMAVHENFGPVVRIGPKHVSFASTQALHVIHASRRAYAKV